MKAAAQNDEAAGGKFFIRAHKRRSCSIIAFQRHSFGRFPQVSVEKSVEKKRFEVTSF